MRANCKLMLTPTWLRSSLLSNLSLFRNSIGMGEKRVKRRIYIVNF